MTDKHIPGRIEKFLSGNGLSDDEFSATLVSSGVDLEGDTTLASGATPPAGTVPLLWGHDPQKVVGKADYKIVGNAVKLRCKLLPKGTSPETNLAWACVKDGDFGMGVSAGFQPIQTEPKKGGRGKTYTKYHLLEASIVAVPCDQNARITARSFDSERQARIDKALALGQRIRREDAIALGKHTLGEDATEVTRPTTKAERMKLARSLALPGDPRWFPRTPQGDADRAAAHSKSIQLNARPDMQDKAARVAIARKLAPR